MEKIQKRVNALKNIQLEIDQAEAKLNDEIIQLECKHAPIFDALYKKRESIVSGEREPSEEEAKWEYENGVVEKENGEAKEKIDTSKPGIPNFWLRVLESARLTRGIIQDADKPILKLLKSIKLKQKTEKPYGFTLEFHFDENEYFTNRVLTKTYEFQMEKDKRNPLLSNNNSLYRCLGCKIDWNEGKCPIKENEADDEDDEGKQGSFFDYFMTHTSDGVRPAFKEKEKEKAGKKNGGGGDEDSEGDEEAEHLFELDYEIGKFIKDMLIPKAVLFYTGEIPENDEDDMDGDFDSADDEDDDDEDDDDDESEEEDTKPTKKKVKTK